MHKDVQGLISFREANNDDLAYIHSSWIQAMKNTYATEGLSHDQWLPVQRNIIRHCMKHSEIHMAVLSEDSTSIVGYIVLDGPVLHWINVKHIYRGYGVGKALIERYGHELKFYSHSPPTSMARKQHQRRNKPGFLNLQYHPFYIWEHYYGIKDSRIILASTHPSEGRDGVLPGSEKVS